MAEVDLAPAAPHAEWLAEVERVFRQAEGWAAGRGWATLRYERPADGHGRNGAATPVLLVHAPHGRFLLTPSSPRAAGTQGRMDFCAYPSMDDTPLVKRDGVWSFVSPLDPEWSLDWSEEGLAEIMDRLSGSP